MKRILFCCWLAILGLSARPSAQEPLIAVTQLARSAQPGDVIRIEIQARARLHSLECRVFDSAFPCYPVGANRWEALVGIDLDARPGRYTVQLHGVMEDGGSAEAARTLTLRPKNFPVRHLTVDEKFVEPPPEVHQRIREDSELLRRIFSEPSRARLWRGAFVRPARGAAISSFGKRSILNGKPRGAHSGTDFAGGTGAPVFAPNAGKVILARNLYFAGNTILLDHGLGLYSLLAHLSSYSTEEGALVERGDVVGAIGATGRVTGPHLHWSVRLGNARVDPLSLIAALRPTQPAKAKQAPNRGSVPR